MIQQEVVEEVLDSIEFEDYIKLEAEKFRQTEAYALLDKEFNVDYKRKVNELRKQYVKIDTGRVQDYCLVLTGNDEDVKKFCSGLTNEGLNFFNLKDVVFIFFDYILELIEDVIKVIECNVIKKEGDYEENKETTNDR